MSSKEDDKNLVSLEKERDKRTIFRKAHNRENPYAQISKSLLRDRRLSAKAMGIMCYLLGLPDNWEINISELARNFSDGEKSIKSGIRELILIGYIEKHQERTEDGLFGGAVMLVHEEPIKNPQQLVRVRRSPLAQKRLAVKRPTEKGIQQKTEINRSLKNNKQDPTKAHSKPEIQNPSQEPDPSVVVSLMEKLEQWAVAETLLRAWLRKHSAEYVLCKIEYTKSYATKNPAGLLRRAIENDYKLPLCKQASSEPKPPAEPVYPTHEENLAWYAGLSDEEKLALQKEAAHKHAMFEHHLKHQNVSVLDANFSEHSLFKMLMEIIGRAK